MNKLAVAVVAAFLLGNPTMAHDYKAGDLHIGHPWSRPAAGQVGAAFMAIVNRGAAPDRLLGGSTPAAERVELHQTIADGDIMRMRPVDAIVLAPGRPVALRPGGLHVMLIGLKAPLKAGDKVPLTLRFEQAGEVQVELQVETGTSQGHHGH